MSNAINRLKAVTAAEDVGQYNLCNQKTAELKQSLNVNVANVFRLEKEHTLAIGPRHTAAYGEWYTSGGKQEIDQATVTKTLKFLGRIFEYQKHMGKRKAQSGEWYFQTNDANLMVVAVLVKKKSYTTFLGPEPMVPYYFEVYYVSRPWLDLPPDHRFKSVLR